MQDWLFERDGIWLLYGFVCFGIGIFIGWAIWG